MAKPNISYKNQLLKRLKTRLISYWQRSLLTKLFVIVIILVIVLTLAMFGVGQWYLSSEKSKPLQLGVSFIPDYAQSLGENPQSAMDALLSIGVRQFRLVSYWSDIETSPGHYDFSQLDWEFKKAESKHATIILTLGLRQPRWPECHAPSWINISAPEKSWQPALESVMQKVVDRYKGSPSLEEYQLENEYFLQGFGNCTNFDRNRLVSEYNLVKTLDPSHSVIIGRSNNTIGFPSGKPRADIYSISVYTRVWDANVSHRYLEYPYPSWYYAFLAGFEKIFLHRDMIIAEMQAEAWPPNGKSITDISLSEQNKSLSAKRLQGRFEFGKATGMRQIEMWGSEYWYYRLTVLHDPSLWNVAKHEFSQN